MPCCVVTTFNRNDFGDIWRICYMWHRSVITGVLEHLEHLACVPRGMEWWPRSAPELRLHSHRHEFCTSSLRFALVRVVSARALFYATRTSKVLSTLATTVAELGDSRRFWWEPPISATVAVFSATVSEFGDCNRQCGQGLSIQHIVKIRRNVDVKCYVQHCRR